jgi:hypothetical protein
MFFRRRQRQATQSQKFVTPDRIHGLLMEMADQQAFNLTVGGNGSVEVRKGGEIIKDTKLPVDQESFLVSTVAWLREITEDHIPKGLRLEPDQIDLNGSLYTFPIEGNRLAIPGVVRIDVGLYGRDISPEATCKLGYIVFRPQYSKADADA